MLKKSLRFIFFILCLGLIFYGLFYIRQKNKKPELQTAKQLPKKVEIINISQLKNKDYFIYTIGQVKSVEQLDIQSELSGKIKKIYVKLGQKVYKGQKLIELENKDFNIKLQQAKHNIERLKADLTKILSGSTKEQIKIADQNIEKAKIALEQSKIQLKNLKLLNEQKLLKTKMQIDILKQSNNNDKKITEQDKKILLDNIYNFQKDALTFVNNTLILITDIQYKYFNCLDNICVQLANLKSKTINHFYKIPNSGRFNTETLAKLKSKIFDDINLKTPDQQEILKNLDYILEGLDLLNNTLIILRSDLDTYKARKSNDLEKNNIDGLKQKINTIISQGIDLKNQLQQTQNRNEKLLNTNFVQLLKLTQIYNNLLNQTKIDEENAQKLVELRQKDLEQAKLRYQQIISKPRDVDIQSLRIAIKQAQDEYNYLLSQKNKTVIYAPFNGTVSNLEIKQGQIINPNIRLLTLLNKKQLQIETYINEKEARKIKKQDKVIIEDFLNGKIIDIAPSIDPITNKIKIIISLNNVEKNKLFIGQFVKIKIPIQSEKQTFSIPLSAIKLNHKNKLLFSIIKKQNKYIIKPIPIKIKKITSSYAIIESLPENLDIIKDVRGIKVNDKIRI